LADHKPLDAISICRLLEIFMKKFCFQLIMALAVFIVGIGIARSVDTVGGSVTVQQIFYTSNLDASLLHGRLYIPANATKDSPAPGVIFFPGNDGDSDKYSMFGVELSRRGYVTFIGDIRGQGQSIGKTAKSGPEDTQGAIEATEYMRALSFVDEKNIILGGHSTGGRMVTATYGIVPIEWYNSYLILGMRVRDFTEFPQGKYPIPRDAQLNMLLVTGRDDGDAKDHTLVADFFGNCPPDQFEPGKVYGSFAERNARVNYQAMGAIHNSEYVNFDVLEAAINFVQGAMPAPNRIDGSSQVWIWRNIGTTIAFFAFIFMFLPLGSLLLATPFFNAIRREVPEYKGNTKLRWWIFALLSAVLPPLTYFSWTSKCYQWLPLGILNVQRATMTLGWTLTIAGVTIVTLVIAYFIAPKQNRLNPVNYGIQYEKGQNLINIGKSLLFAILLVFTMHAILAVTYRWTLIDVRIWNSSIRVLNAQRVIRALTYFIPFTLSYAVMAVNIHGTLRLKNGNLSILRETLVNIAILAPWYWVWAIRFGPFAWLKHTGRLPSFAGQMYAFFWAVPITMIIIATMSTYFFRKTGRIFVGAFINGLLVSWTLLGGFSNMGFALRVGALAPR
jgi:hypothetical protein